VSECYFHCAKAFLRSGLSTRHMAEEMSISFGREIAQRLLKASEPSTARCVLAL
jgi:hypothetical protein